MDSFSFTLGVGFAACLVIVLAGVDRLLDIYRIRRQKRESAVRADLEKQKIKWQDESAQRQAVMQWEDGVFWGYSVSREPDVTHKTVLQRAYAKKHRAVCTVKKNEIDLELVRSQG